MGFGFFDSTKTRTVIVGGGLSRVRADEFIKETTGLVVVSALQNKQDLTDALVLNATTGTVASYSSFNRRCIGSSEIGLPTTSFTYSNINKDLLSAAIRSQTGNAYPLSAEIDEADVSLKLLTTGDEHLKYHLQESYSYNLTTNILTYSTKDYYYDTYIDIVGGYDVDIYRTKVITTTTTSAISVYYDVGEAKWKHKDTITTDVDYVYDPPGETGSSSSSVDNITDYDTIGNPYSLDLSDTGVTFNICIIGGLEYLCDPSVVVTNENDPVTFTLSEPRPEDTIDGSDYLGNIQIKSNEYWVVYYTHSAREYIWVVAYDEQFAFEELTEDVGTNPYLVYAPVIPIRNDTVNYSPSNEPVKYKQANACLKVIGLTVEGITEQITESVVEDAYVSMFSPLVSAHQDQLAYNYAFFDYMEGISVNGETEFNNSLNDSSIVYSFNRLSLDFSAIYSCSVSWGYIKKSVGVIGALTNTYEYEIIDTTSKHWVTDIAVTSYYIRKKITVNTYDEIEVVNFMLEYTVYASGGDNSVFSVGATTADKAQLVIPVSFQLAKDYVPRNDLETFYLRSTYVGIFSKVVQETETKWYEEDWFLPLATIAAIAIAAYTGQFEALSSVLGTSTALTTTAIVATATVLLKYAVIQFALSTILTKVYKDSDSGFLKAIATIAFIYASIYAAGGDTLSTMNQILSGTKAALEASQLAVKIDLQKEIQEFKQEFDKFNVDKLVLTELQKEINTLAANQALGAQAIELLNIFRDTPITEVDIFDITSTPNYMIDLVNNFTENAMQFDDLANLFTETENLLKT